MFTFNNKQRILILFLGNPSVEFHLREIARKVGLSPAGTLKIVKTLLKENLVIKEKSKLKDDYRANVESKEYMALKQAYNLYLINSSGLIDYLYQKLTPDAIILFGSFARGDNHAESDIDIAAINGKSIKYDINKFEISLKHKVSLHFINLKRTNPEFKNNLVNGIVLKGFMKVF